MAGTAMSSDSNTSCVVSKQKQKIQIPFWVHFISGGISGSISAVATCPLELVKTRFQSSQYYTENIAWSFKNHPIKATLGNISSTLGSVR